MRQQLIVLLVVCLLAISAGHAKAVSLNQVIAAVEDPLKIDRVTGESRLTSVTAQFFQRSTIAAQSREMRANGLMYFKPATSREPLMFRFEYLSPTNHEIITDGRTLWTYLPANRQVIRSDVAEFFNPYTQDLERKRAVNFLQGLSRISKDFSINFASGQQDIGGNYVLELNPRRASVTIEKLLVVVDQNAVRHRADPKRFPFRPEYLFPILSTTMIDHDGNTTTMEFSDIRTNIWLADALFSFVVPAGVDVVRPPKGR